jgi:hypothetical protein
MAVWLLENLVILMFSRFRKEEDMIKKLNGKEML